MLTFAVFALGTVSCSDADTISSAATDPPAAVPAHLQYDAGEGEVGAELTASFKQVNGGERVDVRKIARRTYEVLSDKGKGMTFSIPPSDWEERVNAVADAAGPTPNAEQSSASECVAAIREAAEAAVNQVASYGDRFPVEDVPWAVAEIAAPAVTSARLAFTPDACGDSDRLVAELPSSGPTTHVTEGIATSMRLSYQVGLAAVLSQIPQPGRSAPPVSTATAP